MKRTLANLTAYLDGLQQYGGNREAASRATGIRSLTALRWLALSRADAANNNFDSVFFFSYCDQEAWLHEHAKMATKAIISDIQQRALLRARDGVWQDAIYQGRRVPQIDYDLIELGFTEAEAIKRDRITGEVLFEQVWHPPNNELSLAMLAAFVKRFAKRLSVDHQHNVGGVLTVSAQPKQVERQRVAPSVATFVEPSALESQAIDGTVEDSAIYDADQPVVNVSVERSLPLPSPYKTLSPLQQDLIDKARAKEMMP